MKDIHILNDLELIEMLSEVSARYSRLIHRPRTKEELDECVQYLQKLLSEICDRRKTKDLFGIDFIPPKKIK